MAGDVPVTVELLWLSVSEPSLPPGRLFAARSMRTDTLEYSMPWVTGNDKPVSV